MIPTNEYLSSNELKKTSNFSKMAQAGNERKELALNYNSTCSNKYSIN